MAWIDDLQKRYLEEDEQDVAGLNERRVSLDRPLDLAADAPAPAPVSSESGDDYIAHITRGAQPSGFGTFIEAVPRTLGEEFSVGLSRGGDQLKGLTYGFLGLAADGLGIERAADWGYDNYRRAMEEAATNAASVQDPFEDIEDLGDAGRYAIGLLGEQLPQLLTTILGGGIGGAVGKNLARRMVVNQIAKRRAAGEVADEAERKVAEEITQGLLARSVGAKAAEGTARGLAGTVDDAARGVQGALSSGTRYGAMTGAYLTNLGQISGGTYGQVRDETGEGGDAAVTSALATSVPGAALDTLFQGFVVSKIPGVNKLFGVEGKPLNIKFGPGRVAAGAASGAAIGSALEGTTEYLQTGLEQAAVGMADPNQTIEERLNAPGAARERAIAGAAGATIGGMLGGGGGALENLAPRTKAEIDKIDGEDKTAPAADPRAGLPREGETIPGTWGSEIDVDGAILRQNQETGLWAVVNPPENYPGTFSFAGELDGQKVAIVNPRTKKGAALLSRVSDIQDGRTEDDEQKEPEQKAKPSNERLVPLDEDDQDASGAQGLLAGESPAKQTRASVADFGSAIQRGGELQDRDRADGLTGRTTSVPDGGVPVSARAADEPRPVFMPLSTPSTDVKNAPPAEAEADLKSERAWPATAENLRREYFLRLGNELVRGRFVRRRDNGDVVFAIPDDAAQMKGKLTKVLVRAEDLADTVQRAGDVKTVEAEFNERLAGAKTTADLEAILSGYVPTGKTQIINVTDNTGARPMPYRLQFFFREGDPKVPTTKQPDGPPVVDKKKLQPALQDVANKASGDEFSEAVSANAAATDQFIQNLEPGEYQVFNGAGEANGKVNVTTSKSGKTKRVQYLSEDGDVIGDAKALAAELNWARAQTTDAEVATPKTEADVETAQKQAEAANAKAWTRGSLARITRDPVRAPKQKAVLPEPEPVEITRQRTDLSAQLAGVRAKIKEASAPNKPQESRTLTTLREQEAQLQAQLDAFNKANPRPEFQNNPLFQVNANGGVEFTRPVYARLTPLLTSPLPRPAEPELLQPADSRVARTESAQARQALFAAGLRGRDLEEALQERTGMTDRELAEQEQAERERIEKENEARQKEYNKNKTNFDQSYNAFKAQVLRALDAGHTVPITEKSVVAEEGRMTVQSGPLGSGLIEFLQNDPDFTIEDRAPADPKTGEAIGPAVPTITGLVWRGLDGKQRPWSARQGSKPASFSRFVTTGETVQVQDPTDWTLTPDAAFEQTTPEQREAMRRTMQREQRQRGDAQDKLDLRLGQIDRQIQKAQEQLETELGKQAANDAARDRRDRVQSEISGLRSAIAGLAADLRFQPTATTERDGLRARQQILREENDAQEKRKANRADQIKQLQAEYKAELDIASSDRAVSSRSKASAKAAKLKERLDSLADQTKKDSEAQRQRTAELNQITKRLRAMPLKLANEKRKLDVRRAEELQVLENSLAQKTRELGAIAVDNKLGERIQQGRDKLARLRDTREDALYEAERQALAFDRSSAIPPEQEFTKPLRGLGSFARVYTTDRTRRLTSEETRLAQSRRRRLKREDLVQQFSQLPETQQIVFRQILGQLLDMFTSGSSIAARDRVLSQLNRGATITLSDEEADTAVAIARDFASNSAAESFLKVVETIRAKGGAPTTLPTEVQLELAAMLMEEIGNAHRTRFAQEAEKQKSTPTRAEFIAEVRLAALELGISPDDVQEILEASPESAQALLDELRNRGTRQITQVRKVETRLVDKDSRLNEEGKSVVGNVRGRIVEGPLTQAQQDAIDKEVRKLEEQKFKLVRNEDGLLTFTRRVDSKPSAQRAFYDRLNAVLDVQSIVTPGSKASMKAQRVSAKALRPLPKDVDAAITAVLARLASNPTRYTVAPATPDVEVAESQDDAQAIRDARLELLELRANLEPGSTAIKEAEARLAELEKNYKTVTVAGRPETRTPIADPARADRETRYLNSLKQLFSEFYKDPDNSPLVIARRAVDAARKQVERDRPRKLKTQQDTVTNEEGDEISLQDLIEANKTNPEAKLYGAGAGNLPPALLARERAEIIRSLPAQVRQDLFEITGLYYDPVIDRLWYRGKTLGSLENIIQKGGSFESFVKGKRKILRKNYSPERLKAVLDAVALMRDEEALNFFDQQRKAQSEQPKPTISLRTTVRDFIPAGVQSKQAAARFPSAVADAEEQRRVEEYIARQNEKRKSGRSGSDAERTVGVGIDLSGVPDSILQSGISDSLGAPIDDVPAQGGVSSAGRASGERSGSVSGNAAQPAARLGRPNTLQPRTIRELTPRATRIFVAAVTGKNVDNLSDDEIDAIYRASDTQAKGGEAVLAGGNVIAQTPQNMADLLATANGFELLTGMALEEQSQARTQERVELFRKNLGDLTEARAFGGIEAFLQAAVDNPALPRKTRLIARELLNANRRLPGTGWNDTIALQIAAFGRNFLSEPVTNKELEKRVKLNADGTAFLVSRAGRGQPEEIPAPKGARAKKAMLAKLQREAMQAIALNSAVPWSGKSVGRDGQYTVYLNLSANHSNREAGAVDTLIHELIHPLIDSKLNGEVELNAVEKAALDRLQKFRREAVLAAAKKKGIDVPEGALSDAEYDTIEAALAQRANQDADQALKSLTDIKEFVNDVIGNPETANLIAELGFGVASADAKYTPTGRGRGVTGVLRSLWNTITTFVTGRQLDDSSPLAEALRDAWSLTFKSLADTPTVVDRALNQSARRVSGVRDPEFSPARIYRNALVAELERGIQQERFIRQQIEARNLAGTTGDRNRIAAEFAEAKAQEAQADAAPPIVAEPENVAAADTNADAAEDNENEVTPGDIRKARLALFQFALSDTEQEFVERINALKQENPDVTFNEVIANVGFDDPIELYYVARGQAATALEKSDLERIAIDIDPDGNVTPEMLQQISARAEREVLSRMDAATIEQDPRTNEWVVRSADRQELTRTRSKAEADAAYQKAVESEPGPAADRLESLAAAARFLASAKLSVTAQKLAGTGLTGSALRQEELGTGRASMFSAAERREILEQFKKNRQRPDAEAGQEFSPEDLAKIKEFEADIAIEEKREAALRAAGEKAAAEFRKRMEAKAKADPKNKPDTSKLQALVSTAANPDDDPTEPDKRKKAKRKTKQDTSAVSNTPFRGVNVEAAVAELKFGNWKDETDKSGRKRTKRYAKLTDSDSAFWNAYNLSRTANAEYREKAKAAFKAKGYTVGKSNKYGYYVTQEKQPSSEVSESLGGRFQDGGTSAITDKDRAKWKRMASAVDQEVETNTSRMWESWEETEPGIEQEIREASLEQNDAVSAWFDEYRRVAKTFGVDFDKYAEFAELTAQTEAPKDPRFQAALSKINKDFPDDTPEERFRRAYLSIGSLNPKVNELNALIGAESWFTFGGRSVGGWSPNNTDRGNYENHEPGAETPAPLAFDQLRKWLAPALNSEQKFIRDEAEKVLYLHGEMFGGGGAWIMNYESTLFVNATRGSYSLGEISPNISESLAAPFERVWKSETIKTRSGGTYVKDPLISAISSTMDARAREKFENRGAKINAEASRASSEIRQLARALKDTKVDPRRVTAALGNLDNPFTDEQMAEIAIAKIDDPGSVEELESEFRKENRQAARERRQAALQSLPRNVRVIVTRMRDHIDVLQRRLKEEGLVTGDLEVAVDDTYGIYLNRSYAIDDDPRWADKVRKNKKVMADARRFLKKRLVELREEKIRASALRRNEFITDDEIRRQAADSVTTTDVENELDNALSREKLDFMMSSIPGQKNLSVFMRRGVIAPEIQALWGVYNSPDTAYGKTVLKLASLIQNHAYLRELRNLGLSEGWFEAPPTLNEDTEANVYIVRDGLGKEIFRTDDLEEAQEAYAEAMEEFDPPASYKPISAKDNPRLSPLAGVYAMPEMLNALYQVYAPQTEDAQAKAVGFFSKVTGYGMAAATVGSAQGQVRNYWGGWLKLLSVGTFFSLPSGAFGMAHKLAIQEAFKTNGGNYQKTRAEIEKLIRLRIYGESVDANTISSLIKDYNTLGRAVASDDDTMMTKLMRPVLNTWDLAKATYSMSDNIMRTLVFYAERENYRKAYPKMSSEDLDQKAAQLARDLFWTYSEAPEWVQNLKRGPGLVLAPFITFPTEVVRTAINTLRIAGEEIKSDNAELRAVGAKRLAGFASAMTIPYLAGQALMAASGLGSDDEEDLRKFLPKWQQNNQLLLTRGPNNSIGYYDISFLDGADVLKKPFTALWRAIGRSESVTEAVATGSVEMLAEMWRPFLSEQLVFGTVASVLRNVDSSGRRIYNPQDSGANIAQAIASQFVGVQGVLGFTGDGVLVPGTFKTAGRFVRGLTGTVTESGQAIDPAQELSALITGTRARQLDLEQALGYSAGEYLRNMRDATSVFNRAFLSRGRQSPGAISAAFEQADIAQYELTKQQRERYLAARRLGLSDTAALSRLKAAGVGNERLDDITSGIYRPLKISDQSKKNAEQQNLTDRLREAEEAQRAAKERQL